MDKLIEKGVNEGVLQKRQNNPQIMLVQSGP